MQTNEQNTPDVKDLDPNSEEYIEAMRAIGRGEGSAEESTEGNGDAEENTDRPDWLPEKFESPEAMAKAYAELEKKQSGADEGDDNAEAGDGEESNGESAGDADAEAAAETLEKVGLDYNAFQQEYAEKGELSEETYQKLIDKGIPREMVDDFIEGQNAKGEAIREAMLASVGGEDAYGEMAAWASVNMSEADLDAYNAAVDSGDLAQAKLAVQGLKAQYEAAEGKAPELQTGGNAGGNVYASTAELRKDMADPRYKTDPAFRERVAAKLKNSNVF